MSRTVERLPVRSGARLSSGGQRLARTPALLILLMFFVPLLLADSSKPDAGMTVPGGVEALARFLRVPADREAFGQIVNRIMLTSIREDHAWQNLAERRSLDRYLEVLEELQSSFPDGRLSTIEAYETMLRILGFDVSFTADGPVLSARRGDNDDIRRQVAAALQWNLTGIGRSIGGGKDFLLEMRSEAAAPPLEFERWSRLAGSRIDSRNALRMLARDPRTGLVIEGMRRLDLDTLRTLEKGELMLSLRESAARAFFRHAGALEIRDGTVVVPGGPAKRDLWHAAVGQAPDHPEAFLWALLSRRNRRLAVLWSELFFTEPEKVNLLLTTPPDEKVDRLAMILKAATGIDDLSVPSGARALGPGIGTLMRALSIDRSNGRLDLPGSTRLWFESLEGNKIPGQVAALEKKTDKWSSKPLSDGSFLRRVLKTRVELGPLDKPLLPRLIRVVALLDHDSKVLTPENVILLTRSADRFPMALAPLSGMRPTDPLALRDYLRAVDTLDRLDHGHRKLQLIATFQGGIELLRNIWETGRVENAALDAHLGRWSRVHLAHKDRQKAAPYQLEWLDSLLGSLPAAADDEPGRGPLERALLKTLLHLDDREEFTWKGLTYSGHRGRDVARTWAAHLEAQGIPAVDDLLEIRRLRLQLEQACRDSDLDVAKRLSTAIDEVLDRLPTIEVRPRPPRDGLRIWFEAVDRERTLRTVSRFQRPIKAPKLRKMADSAVTIEEGLAGDLRSFFLAQAYLPGLQHADPSLLGGASLIRTHSLIQNLESQRQVIGDSPWDDVVLGVEGFSDTGSMLVGHLRGVPRALGRMLFLEGGEVGRVPVRDHLGIWFDDLVSTPWRELRPEINVALHQLLELGQSIVDAGRAGPSEHLLRRHVPAARRPAAPGTLPGLVLPSELLQIGLAALDAPEANSAATAAREALAALDAGDAGSVRRLLADAGAATAAMDGRYRRHVEYWPPYEALERGGVFDALVERQLLDLRLVVLDYLGRHRLPGDLGADLMHEALRDLSTDLPLVTRMDWETVVRKIKSFDAAYFDEVMRRCLADGRYSLDM